jgi:hypothetical protein
MPTNKGHRLFSTWGEYVEAKDARSASARKGAATRRANDPRNAPCTATYTSKATGRTYACQSHMQGYHVNTDNGRQEWRIE